MRTVWNILSFLAFVHLLALIIVIAWLWKGDRLNPQRLQSIKHILSMTVAEEDEAIAKAEQDAQTEQMRLAAEARDADPPVDSVSQIAFVSHVRLREEQALRRLEHEKAVLLQELMGVTTQINQQRLTLDQRQKSLAAETQDDQQRKNDEQFLQTVRQYEQLSPKQGKKMLVELVNQNQMDQAVAYLVRMNSRASAKILKEFKTDVEITLATELLERMRTHGLETPTSAAIEKSAPLANGNQAGEEFANASAGTNAAP